MSTDKITMWEHKLLDLGLRNQLIKLRLTKKTIPVLVPSLSRFEDLLVSGKDFTIVSGKDNNEVPSEQEQPAEGENAAPAKTLPRKEFGFEDMHDLTGFEDLVNEKFEEKKILTPITQNDLDERIKNLYRGYKSSLEENGANTLYIAMGLLKWYEEEDKSKCHYAPLVLVPIQIIRRSLALGYKLTRREEDTMLNISIVEKLKAEFDIRIEGLEELPEDESGVDLPKIFSVIRDAIAVKPEWEVLESAYIGLFSFTQFVMWNDLKKRGKDLEKNKIVKALIDGAYPDKELPELDPADATPALTPLPADASQLKAIHAAYEGESFVLHGPPGTGKSQTITSMIANSLYQGHKVLFVAEKKAALEVVYNRLSKLGLAPFCLELHSNKARKSDVLNQLDNVRKIREEHSDTEFTDMRRDLNSKKDAIDKYVKALHYTHECEFSVFELISIYESSKDAPDVAPFGTAVLDRLKASVLERIKTELNELAFVGKEYKIQGSQKLSFVKGQNYSMTMRETVPAKAAAYKEALLKLKEISLGKSLEEIKAECEKYRQGQETAKARDQILLSWDKDLLGEDARSLIKEYKEAETKWALFKTISVNSVYKKVAVYDLKKDKKNSLLAELTSLQEYQEREKTYPIVEDRSLFDAYSEVSSVRADLSSLVGLDDLKSIDSDIEACDILSSNSDLLKMRMQYNKEASELLSLGANNLVEAYDNGVVDEDNIIAALEKAYSRQKIMQIVDSSDVLSEFSGNIFEGRVEAFKKLSEEFTELTKKEIYLKLASGIPNFKNLPDDIGEYAKLTRAIQSQGRNISFRKLFSEIPNLLRTLCPCMLMSPISVAQYLELNDDIEPFDTVIFDEASQLPTCKAVGVLARGKNAIVVGDPKQMPPTSFFMSEYVDEENIEQEDLESILDDCLAVNMPSKYLQWHYRSKHESLIDFSNKAFYENRLYTFPSANDLQSMVNLVQVDGVFDRGNTRTNLKEAEAVIEEIVRRFKDPVLKKQSVGVVTFNINQQNKIDDLLQEECKKVEGLEAWAYSSEEPIFVKNLENVQGDERDVILFSVGYGKDEEGNVYMNFGPLNLEGGWRRLNVAVTRARCEMKVFSTLTPEQIKITSSTSRGVQAMRRFLEYASGSSVWSNGLEETYATDNVNVVKTKKYTGVADAVVKGLSERGYKCNKDIGKSGYKIDIGVVDKDNDGVYCAGILIDGESYKNAGSTRDREIAQISVLEGLGWKVMRVWSMDWLEDPEKTLEKVINFIETSKEEPVVEEEPEDPAPEEKTELMLAGELIAPDIPVVEEGDASSSSEDILIPYKVAVSPVEAMVQKDLEDPQLTAKVQEKIWWILEQEAPISTDLLAKRLAASCGNMKATAKVKERTDYHCRNAKITKTTYNGVDFWWNADQDPSSYELIRVAGDAASRRAASDIPLEEAMNAVAYVVRAGVGVPRESVAKDAAKLMGYTRPNADLIALFEAALSECMAKDILKEGSGGNIVAGSN